jgi:hypothetical protein|tara:strand:- start:525 stop:713 length:189 start_codon:yes stop_codon:yes gene_type:complete
MVSIHHTPQGWNLVAAQDLGYYTSLGDVMDAAYAATNGKGDNAAVSAVRDQTCHHSGSATGG